MKERCHYCEKPPVVFCDFYVDGPTGLQTCDRAICADHARKIGHICTRPRSKSDTIDFCKAHGEAGFGLSTADAARILFRETRA